jgi:hypothetical protein
MNRFSRRFGLAALLGELCSPTLAVTDPQTGWPAAGMVALPSELRPVDIYVGPIGLSHRGRDHVERRFQNPGKNKPVFASDGRFPLLLGLWTEGDSPVLVGMDARRHVNATTRKSLFVSLRSLRLAQQCGWAGHVSSSGEWILCFSPDRLADYVAARLQDTDADARG